MKIYQAEPAMTRGEQCGAFHAHLKFGKGAAPNAACATASHTSCRNPPAIRMRGVKGIALREMLTMHVRLFREPVMQIPQWKVSGCQFTHLPKGGKYVMRNCMLVRICERVCLIHPFFMRSIELFPYIRLFVVELSIFLWPTSLRQPTISPWHAFWHT